MVAFFFTSMTVLEGKKFEDVKERLSKVSFSVVSLLKQSDFVNDRLTSCHPESLGDGCMAS